MRGRERGAWGKHQLLHNARKDCAEQQSVLRCCIRHRCVCCGRARKILKCNFGPQGEHGVPHFVVAILRKRSRDHLSLWDTWDRIGKNSNELVPLASCPSMRYSGGSSKSGKVWISRGLAEGTQFLLLSPLPHGTKRTLAGRKLLARADPFSDAEY